MLFSTDRFLTCNERPVGSLIIKFTFYDLPLWRQFSSLTFIFLPFLSSNRTILLSFASLFGSKAQQFTFIDGRGFPSVFESIVRIHPMNYCAVFSSFEFTLGIVYGLNWFEGFSRSQVQTAHHEGSQFRSIVSFLWIQIQTLFRFFGFPAVRACFWWFNFQTCVDGGAWTSFNFNRGVDCFVSGQVQLCLRVQRVFCTWFWGVHFILQAWIYQPWVVISL